MKTSSAKAKGRKLATHTRDRILEWFKELESDDVRITPSGVQGEDLQLSPKAKNLIKVAWEAKNTKAFPGLKALEQSKKNAGDRIPVVVYHFPRSLYEDSVVYLSLEDFLAILYTWEKEKNG